MQKVTFWCTLILAAWLHAEVFAQGKAIIHLRKETNGKVVEESREIDLSETTIEKTLEEMGAHSKDGNTQIRIEQYDDQGSNSLLDPSMQITLPGFGQSPTERRAYLGVMLREQELVTTSIPQGVLITEVVPQSPAYGKLQTGDILLRIDDTEIHHVEEVIQAIRSHQKGDEVKVTFQRNGKKKKEKITLDEREMEITQTFPGFGQFSAPIFIDTLLNNWNLDETQPQRKAFLGVMPHPENNDVAGAKIDVQKGSAADKMGLISGDVVTQFNDQVVTSFQSLSDAVAQSQPGEDVRIIVQRDGKIKSFEGALGEREVTQSGDFRIFRDYKGRDEGGNYTYDFELDMSAGDLQNQMQMLMDSLFGDSFQLQFPNNQNNFNASNRSVGIGPIQAEDRSLASWLPTENAADIDFNQLSIYSEMSPESQIRVKLESTNTTLPIHVELLNSDGTIVFIDDRKNTKGIYDNAIPYEHLPNGAYFLIVKQGVAAHAQKLTIH